MQFQLRDDDMVLIGHAIALGERLKAMPETTPEIAASIGRFQEVLRRLPEATPTVEAGYGFGIMSDDPAWEGVNRAWYVSQETGPRGRPRLTIYSVYTIVPVTPSLLPDRNDYIGRAAECFFPFYVEQPPLVDPRYYTAWVNQVRDPDWWRNPDQNFEVEGEFSYVAPGSRAR